MSTHDNTPSGGPADVLVDELLDETAEHILEPSAQGEGAPDTPPIRHAPPPAVRSEDALADDAAVSGDDTGVFVRPTGLALRVAVAEGAPADGPTTPFEPETQLGPDLLGQLLAHKLTEGLQMPTPEAQARAKPYFDRWVQTARGLPSGEAETQVELEAEVEDESGASRPSPDAEAPARPASGPASGARHYPIAQSLLPDADDARAQAPAPVPEVKPKRTRPPADAPSIRPAAPKRRQPADVVPQDLLQQASDTAVMWSDPSGGTSFRIDFADEFFQDVACIITASGRDVWATFYVEDVNARRLLEAESRRLQGMLEARGLVHAQVRIVTGAPPQPFMAAGDDEPA